ncbi:hypothetical protein [Bacillus anthracis]|uniref:hypothetical protein n=1 Tax=Bacillus anthracis TaxID=1392 RepID=UPI0013C2D67F|nr:hypothetical protein [Bacillus anthracis]
MSFTIKCNKCGYEQHFKEDDSFYGEKVEIQPRCWSDEIYLSIECKNPNCKESIDFK